MYRIARPTIKIYIKIGEQCEAHVLSENQYNDLKVLQGPQISCCLFVIILLGLPCSCLTALCIIKYIAIQSHSEVFGIKLNKFEMFKTIVSFINLIPNVFKVAYVHHITLKSRYNLLERTFRYVCLNISCLKGSF